MERAHKEMRGVGRSAARLLACLALLSAVAGCSRNNEEAPVPWPAPEEPRITLAPGDEIEVNFRYWPELNETQIIRPDGKIALQLVDDVYVEGLTPAEVDDKLTALYEDQLVNPVLTVVVRGLDNQRFYVGGMVEDPGLYQLRGRLSVLEAILEAGGFDEDNARRRQVLVIRQTEGVRIAKEIDLRQTYGGEGITEPFYLEPRDVVYVPRTKISRVNQWVDQYIDEVLPEIVNSALQLAVFSAVDSD